jgi:hypothetical protein
MDDTLEKLWKLPTVREPTVGRAEVTETEEKTENEDKCQGCAGRPCSNAAVVRIYWTTCICGKSAKSCVLCIPCYEGYEYTAVGNTRARTGCCKNCKSPVYMRSVKPIR